MNRSFSLRLTLSRGLSLLIISDSFWTPFPSLAPFIIVSSYFQSQQNPIGNNNTITNIENQANMYESKSPYGSYTGYMIESIVYKVISINPSKYGIISIEKNKTFLSFCWYLRHKPLSLLVIFWKVHMIPYISTRLTNKLIPKTTEFNPFKVL